MRTPRSCPVVVAVVLVLGGFTACHKVHPATQAKEEEMIPPDSRPVLVAANRPAAPAAPAVPAPKEKADADNITSLHLEVGALETIHQLQLTRAQLERLARLAPGTAQKALATRETKVSEEYQKTLKELRDALVEDDEDRITDLSVALDELREKEEPDFEEVEITDVARRLTPEVLKSLTAGQVAGYLVEFADEFPDPGEKLTEALDEIRKENGKEWEELRDEVAGQVAWLVAGLDKTAEAKVRERVKGLLIHVHKLTDDEYTAKKPELERSAQAVIGNVGPTDVIRHFTERSLAELLSNPRLATAVEALLKKEDK
jgi:hypothetical protein